MSRSKKVKRIVRKLIRVFLILVLAGIVVGEVGLRIFYGETLKTQVYPMVYQPDSILGYRYIPNIQARISIPGIDKTFKINNQGFYGPDFSTEKPENTFRIAIVGYSEASGIWLNAEENFPIMLERKLKDAGYRVEVINCSVDGRYRSVANLEMIEHVVVHYDPDLVFLTTNMPFVRSTIYRDMYKGYVMIYGEKKNSRKRCEKKIDYITDHRLLGFLYDVSYIVRAGCHYYYRNYRNQMTENLGIFKRKRMQAPDISFSPMASNRSADMVSRADSILCANGSELIVFQYNENDFYDTIAKIHNLPYLELRIPYDDKLKQAWDGHYNEQGHEVVADSFFSRITRDSLIPLRFLNPSR